MPAAERPPNIILILADDLRYDALGCTGNTILQTPHIDRLAARGTVFTNSFCTTAICPVSRASIITGQYERRHKIADFSTPLSKQRARSHLSAPCCVAMATELALSANGGLAAHCRPTNMISSVAFPDRVIIFRAANSEFRGEHLTAKQAAQAVEFLEKCSDRQPFLLQISTKAPHAQDDNLKRPFPADPQIEQHFE